MIERMKGNLDGAKLHVAVVVSRWNSEITEALLAGALRALHACSVPEDQIRIVEVPGALEIPVAAQALAMQAITGDNLDAVIAIGCVIKGETAHFDHVGRVALDGIARVSGDYELPVTCGILTAYDFDQARARSGSDEANVGSQAALTAVEVANLLRSLDRHSAY